mmetsp:Transcript_22412/g.40411  ORF Transcript_22412/g.40411 Transcript_22412/m.40411 type:complete len:86 (-) Transcript_22412:3637-3894(-)
MLFGSGDVIGTGADAVPGTGDQDRWAPPALWVSGDCVPRDGRAVRRAECEGAAAMSRVPVAFTQGFVDPGYATYEGVAPAALAHA